MHPLPPSTGISTNRLELRALRDQDRDEFVRVHRESAEHFAPWVPLPDPHQTLEDLFATELARGRHELEAGTGARLAGFLRDGSLVGFFSLNMIFRRAFQNAYAGWRVAVDQKGRGLGTEAVQGLLDIAFAPAPDGLGLHRVQANVIPDNAPSIRVAEKAGFRLEGRAKGYLHIAGSWQDHLMFAKLVDEHTPGEWRSPGAGISPARRSRR